MSPKSIFTSRTIAAQVITLAAAFYPPARAIVAANPGETLVILALTNSALRWITKGRVVLFV
jgi:hypothetical protein